MVEKKKTSESEKGKSLVRTKKQKLIIPLRGRKFQGTVIRKFEGRVTIEFERTRFIQKYERYIKTKTKMHARLPEKLKNEIALGDYIQIQECRPLSKILHHIVINKIRDGDKNESN
nr:30S ribosomal protein S17P [uncultured archaeon]